MDNASVGARQKKNCVAAVFAIAVVTTIVLTARDVQADSFCGGGRRVGAENDGAGKSWLCVPDAPRSSRSGSSSSAGIAAANRAIELAGDDPRVQHQPNVNIANLRAMMPMQRADDMSRYLDGLRKAGVPE